MLLRWLATLLSANSMLKLLSSSLRSRLLRRLRRRSLVLVPILGLWSLLRLLLRRLPWSMFILPRLLLLKSTRLSLSCLCLTWIILILIIIAPTIITAMIIIIIIGSIIPEAPTPTVNSPKEWVISRTRRITLVLLPRIVMDCLMNLLRNSSIRHVSTTEFYAFYIIRWFFFRISSFE